MYRTIQDFVSDFNYESEATLKLLKELTDESLHVKVHPMVRTAGFLTWHIIHSIKEMAERTGLKIDCKDQEYNGESAKELYAAFDTASKSLLKEVQTWSDETLLVEDDMYGEKWNRGTTLSILVKHQAHHRGQLEVIMRINGLKVPGVYGPSAEEWTAWGKEPMK
jgi:uncharacterized damage-inducible protein DinB